jgi:hypothetical protein
VGDALAPWRHSSLLLLAWGVVAWSTGCTTHQCDPVTVAYSGGEMTGPDTYETNPIDLPPDAGDAGEPWLDYTGNKTITVTFPPEAKKVIAGRQIDSIEPFVGISSQPNSSGNNWTPTGGQLAEITSAGPDGFTVTNASCADYFARFRVTFVARDAGTDASDAAGSDAGDQ